MGMMLSRWAGVGLALGLFGCDADSVPASDGGTPAADARAACDVDDPCATGAFCSATGICVADGTCVVHADCPEGERCGAASLVCIAAGGCAADGDCADGLTCDEAMGTCSIGSGCGGVEFALTRQKPNVLIVLDRSGSMSTMIGEETRWDIAKSAVQALATQYDDSLRLGLATYSACAPGGCSAGTVVVPVADTNGASVSSFLAPLLGRGSATGASPDYLCETDFPETSTGATLFSFVGNESLLDEGRDNYVLLVTDGIESAECTEDGTQTGTLGAAALAAQSPSVKTFVVGFSEDVADEELAAVATAGGTNTPFRADDASALNEALDAIVARVATCDFVLTGEVPDPALMHVYFNDEPVEIARDSADGWSFDPTSSRLVLLGAACESVLMGAVEDIDVVYGCEGPVLF